MLIMCSITTILSIIEIVLKLVSPVSLWTHYHKRRQTLWWMKIVRRVVFGEGQEGLGAHGDQKSSHMLGPGEDEIKFLTKGSQIRLISASRRAFSEVSFLRL